MRIAKLPSFPIEQIADLDALERRLGSWAANAPYPIRLLATSDRFDLRPVEARLTHQRRSLQSFARLGLPLQHAVDALLDEATDADPTAVFQAAPPADQLRLVNLFATAPSLQVTLAGDADLAPDEQKMHWAAIADTLDTVLWRLPWIKEQARFYEVLKQHHLRRTTYLMLTWEGAEVSAAAISGTLSSAVQRRVQLLDYLPGVLPGLYTERMTHLAPERAGLPYLATLLSYDVRGEWTAETLHGLLDVPFDVALAVDVRTLSRNKAQRAMELAYNAARMQARDMQVVDIRAQRVMQDAELVMHELPYQSLHDVLLAVLVSGESIEQLDTNIAEVQGRLGSQLRLLRPDGVHGEALKFWSTTPAHLIDVPQKRRNILSKGVGCCFGVLGYHRSSTTDGILWGLDSVRHTPLFADLFADNQAAHMVVLGKTGAGKTFFINVTTIRAAALEGYRVIAMDAFENGKRIESAVGAGARCNWIGTESLVNILDVVYSPDTEGGWLASQVQHVIGQLALLLGTPERNMQGREQYIPRVLTTDERGVFDLTLMDLYATVSPIAPLDQMPVLSDLIEVLDAMEDEIAVLLAQSLRRLLFGENVRGSTRLNTLGRCFNGHTTVDWRFERDINYFDFSRVPEILRPFYYAQNIGAINRFMRDTHRDRSRRTLLIIDEFGYAAQVEAVARLAADICKVARKFGIGLIVVDQNPTTFLDSQNGRYIFENAAAKIMFHLDDLPARQMADAISDLNEGHVELLTHAGKGECIAVFGNDVYAMRVEANAQELRTLRGS